MATTDAQFHGTPRFRIVSRIGVNASSAVYKAFDEQRGAFVALRTLPPLSNASERALRDEFQALKSVRHPSLVALQDLECADGIWFYTMELVEGVRLREYVRRRPQGSSSLATRSTELPVDETLLRSALGQLVRALVTLHDAARLHGALDPDSIQVSAQGRLVLLDACVLEQWLRGEAAEMSVLRSLPFVAPERLEGGPASTATDWYGVGALLYDALRGAPPFAESTGAELSDAKFGAPPELPDDAPGDLAQLCVDLLAADPDARPTGEEVLSRLHLRRETGSRYSQTFSTIGEAPPFVGRKRELSLLAEAFERTRHGSVSTLCLHGEAGVGKRTLTLQLSRRLRREYPHLVHLHGRCHREGPVAYRGLSSVVEGLARYLSTQDANAVATLLPQDAALLPRLFPSMGRVTLAGHARDAQRFQDPPTVRRLAVRALRKLLRSLSQRHPMLMVIDDVQWADPDTVAVLDQLVSPPDPPHMLLLLLLSGAPGEASPAMRQWLGRRDDLVTHMRLRELSKRSSRELTESLLTHHGVGDEHAAQVIVDTAQGHPLWIDALARHRILYEHLPPEGLPLLKALETRVELLPPDAREVLEVLSLASLPLPVSVLGEACGQSSEPLARKLGTLRLAGLLRSVRLDDVERVGIAHPVFANVVEGLLTEERSKDVHRRLAAAMGGLRDAPGDAVAHHWLKSGNPDRAGRALTRAASAAQAQLAFDASVVLYQQALAHGSNKESERHELRVQLAHAYANSGRGERAARTYLDAADHADPSAALELRRRAALQLLRSGLPDEGLEVASRVLSGMGVRLASSRLGSLGSLMLGRARLALRGTHFVERAPSQIPPQELAKADILASLAGAIGTVDSLRAADAKTRHLLMVLELGDPARLARALASEANYLATVHGTHQESWMRALERSLHLAAHSADSQARGLALAVQGAATFLGGAFRDNVDACRQADRVLSAECTDVDWEVGNARVYAAISRFYLGELRALSQTVQDQVREARERGDHYTYSNLRIAVGYLPLLMGNDPRGAAMLLDEAIRSWGRSSFQVQHALYVLGRAQIDAYQGAPGAYARTMAAWPHLSQSLLLHVSMIDHTARHLRGRAALSDARHYPVQKHALLRDAAACADILLREPVGYANGWGFALRAGVARLRGDDQGAVRHLQRAESQFYETEMGVYSAAVRMQLGHLLPEREGRPLLARAREWFASQGVARPQRFADMLLPGLG